MFKFIFMLFGLFFSIILAAIFMDDRLIDVGIGGLMILFSIGVGFYLREYTNHAGGEDGRT